MFCAGASEFAGLSRRKSVPQSRAGRAGARTGWDTVERPFWRVGVPKSVSVSTSRVLWRPRPAAYSQGILPTEPGHVDTWVPHRILRVGWRTPPRSVGQHIKCEWYSDWARGN